MNGRGTVQDRWSESLGVAPPGLPPMASTRRGPPRRPYTCGCDRVRVVAIELERPMGRPSLNEIVLVTDGQIGFESEVIGEIASRLPRSSRVHTVGVGSAVNRTLTGAAARAGARRRGDHRSG
jgi:hypothetical protein